MGLQLLVLFGLTPISLGQQKRDIQKELEIFRQSVEGTQFAELRSLADPKIADYIAIAERADKQIYTESKSDLRQLARDIDSKVIDLQTSDLGKWMATKPNLIASFLKFDTETLSLNDEALHARRARLRASADALKAYNTATQGRFDADKNEAALAIMEDANWVELTYRKLRERLSIIELYEAEYPKDFDPGDLPTLEQVKAAKLAEMIEVVSMAELKAREDAARETADLLGKSIFERDVASIKTRIAGDEKLAELDRRLMEAEFGVKMKETEKRIVETQIQEMRVGDSITETKSRSYDERLTEYLQSDRVRQILQPFCGKGFAEASTGNEGYKRISSLQEAPMSLGIINQRRALSPEHQSMIWLIKIANFSRNDRGGWPVDQNTYGSAPKDFANMDGEMVNPYIEAQRILREHGAKLIELKMLRP